MSTKVTTYYNNFARAKTDRDLNGRFDLPVYSSSAEEFKNFISNFKGNAIYSSGFINVVEFQDCSFIEFKFNNQQQYLCVFYANKIRFLSFAVDGSLGWVLDGGASILEVDTPYTLDECKELFYTQNFDNMEICHPNHQPRRLVRLSANLFDLQVSSRKNDPFILTNTGVTKSISAITQAANAQITMTAHGFSVGDSFTISGVSGMSEINDYTVGVVSVVDANNVTVSLDTTQFTAYTSGGTADPVDTTDNPKVCLYYGARLYYANTPTRITTIFASVDGIYDDFADTPIDDTSAVIFTLTNIAQEIEWLFDGENSLIVGASDGLVAVYGGQLGTKITAENIDTQKTSAEPANDVFPLKKDGYVFYITLDGRRMNYFNYDLLSESFKAEDANILSYDITKCGVTKIRYKRDRNDLIFGLCGGRLLSANIKISERIIGWHERTTEGNFEDIGVITDNEGKFKLFALVERDGDYFIEIKSDYVEFSSREDFFTDDEDVDDRAYQFKIAEELKDAVYLDNSRTFTGLQTSNTITFDGTDTITAGSSVFSSGDIGRQISYQTETGYEEGRFEIIGYTSGTEVTVDVLQTPTTNTYDNWYLSFDTITGLSDFNGKTVSVVVDGGLLDEFEVSGGEIDLGQQVLFALVGYDYKGLIKTFPLGFQAGRDNTQATTKGITRAGVRVVDSAGGDIGSSPYRFEAIQKRSSRDVNYLPTTIMNGTKDVNYLDDLDVDKHLYIIQDKPLPLHITAVFAVATYTVRR